MTSRIKEGLAFKTDAERLAWFESLTPDEQAGVINDAVEYGRIISKAFQPVAESITRWWKTVYPILTEMAHQIERAPKS